MTKNTTPMTLTPERLKEIEERAKKATPGPWEGNEQGFIESEAGTVCQVFDNPDTGMESIDDEPSRWNTELISHCRTDIPDLLTHIAEQDKEIERLREAVRVKDEALKDIRDWDDKLEEQWEDPGYRAQAALSPKVGGGE